MIENEKRLSAAMKRYDDEEISLGKAAQMAGLSKEAFMQELGARGIPCIRYDAGDLELEVRLFDR